tara:strand:- start:11737 stop:12276 length:540 start_codon:yes stop_codon:yes gene_type:complete
MGKIIYKRATSNEELHQILALQSINLPSLISEEIKLSEGFVTVQHTFELLKTMNDACAHTIAKSDGKVIGYALSMVKDFKNDIDVLKPMFQHIEDHLPKVNYIVMGQVCVDSAHRGKGIFRGLYNAMKENLKDEYDTIVTEVDKKNTRSLNAHYASGFKELFTYHSNHQDWVLIYLDLD